RDSSASSAASRVSAAPSSMRSPRLCAGPLSSQDARNKPASTRMMARTFMTTLLFLLRDLAYWILHRHQAGAASSEWRRITANGPDHQGQDEQQDKQDEQDTCNVRRGTGDAGKTEQACHDRNYEEGQCPPEHGKLRFLVCLQSGRPRQQNNSR